jgi:hypothetical protein
VSCRICGGEQYEAEPHTTEEHSESWVSLADARYTGEVIFMPTHLIFDALNALDIQPTLNEKIKKHVDRKIIQALHDAFEFEDDDTGIAEALAKVLKDNPEREPLS